MDGGDTQIKVKWTDTPGKKIKFRKWCPWLKGQKAKAGINLYPQILMQFIIHMEVLHQETCTQQILKT